MSSHPLMVSISSWQNDNKQRKWYAKIKDYDLLKSKVKFSGTRNRHHWTVNRASSNLVVVTNEDGRRPAQESKFIVGRSAEASEANVNIYFWHN